MSFSEIGWHRLLVAFLLGVSIVAAPAALDPLVRAAWPWLRVVWGWW